ncbi:MAG: energy transducer TonB [Terriglobales bacterium]
MTALAAMCLLTPLILAAPDSRKDLERRLKSQLENKALALTQPYAGERLRFDSEGNLQGPATQGGWAGDAYFQIHSVSVQRDSFALIGNRLVGFFDQQGNWQLVWKDEPLRLEFTFPPRDLDEAGAHAILGKVVRDSAEIPKQRGLPDVSNFRSEKLEIRQDKTLVYRLRDSEDWKPLFESPEAIEVGEIESGRKVYVVTRAVKPPKRLNTPDPEYPDSARADKRGGGVAFRAIVSPQGTVHGLQLRKADDWDLAVQAAKAVSRWTFEPATIEGRPVAVILTITVDFRLY